MLSPGGDRPYFVFHDAWQYFDREFGLRGGGQLRSAQSGNRVHAV
jgi:ABC-type Zn2+ transport system substrate-binding protein/surface adhesin